MPFSEAGENRASEDMPVSEWGVFNTYSYGIILINKKKKRNETDERV